MPGPVAQILSKRAPTWVMQLPSLLKPEQRQELQKEVVGATRDRMVREICEALEAITAETPLVFILEDLHWVDTSTLDFISALARRREAAKLVVVCTYRPADVLLSQNPLRDLKHDLQVHRLCAEIALERLETPDIARYLATEFFRQQVAGWPRRLDSSPFGRKCPLHGGYRPGHGQEWLDSTRQRRMAALHKFERY